MIGYRIAIALLAIFLNESRPVVEAATAGTALAPFSKPNHLNLLVWVQSFSRKWNYIYSTWIYHMIWRKRFFQYSLIYLFQILASATATSTYANNAGCYGVKFAIDGYSDNTGCNFFHSAGTEGYPYVSAVMSATNVNSVSLKSRCDANGWGHTQFTIVVR